MRLTGTIPRGWASFWRRSGLHISRIVRRGASRAASSSGSPPPPPTRPARRAALGRDRDALFLAEPPASLDPAAAKADEDIIAGVAASGVKIVMATHELGLARRLAGGIG